MLTVNNLSLQFGKRILFEDVNIKFTQGNCYGVIGANGAGKSTFLKIISGELDPTGGSISLKPDHRMAVLNQNHFEFENEEVLNTVIMGHREMYDIMIEKDAIYMDPDATEADGLHAAELEDKFGQMGGWTSDSDAAELLSQMGVPVHAHHKLVKELSGPEKVKVLLAQALFGNPDLLVLDEPTNDLDAQAISWLADFLAGFPNTVIVVSHDRYFLDMVCTHIVDIDFSKIRLFSGNYTFWYESSELLTKQLSDKNKKTAQKRKELQEFVARFSANASKSRQATSRKKALEKLTLEDLQPSSRKYPYIQFNPERAPGGQILEVKNLSAHSPTGEVLFENVEFLMNKGDKIGVVGKNSAAITAFFDILAGEKQPTTGEIDFGQTITKAYLPNENEEYFSNANNLNLVDWLRQFSEEKDEQFIRGFLGRMLFSGDEVHKKSSVLSGGEKVRCMLSKVMLSHPNFVLLDEPTNHLDLEAITALNNALRDFEGNLIMASHDYKLMNTAANRILEIGPDGFADRLLTFEDYIARKREETEAPRDGLGRIMD